MGQKRLELTPNPPGFQDFPMRIVFHVILVGDEVEHIASCVCILAQPSILDLIMAVTFETIPDFTEDAGDNGPEEYGMAAAGDKTAPGGVKLAFTQAFLDNARGNAKRIDPKMALYMAVCNMVTLALSVDQQQSLQCLHRRLLLVWCSSRSWCRILGRGFLKALLFFSGVLFHPTYHWAHLVGSICFWLFLGVGKIPYISRFFSSYIGEDSFF